MVLSLRLLSGESFWLALTAEDINRDLARRQLGYGRGGRMKIEKDTVAIRSEYAKVTPSARP